MRLAAKFRSMTARSQLFGRPAAAAEPPRCPAGSWSKTFARRCRLDAGHKGQHDYEVTRARVGELPPPDRLYRR